MSQLPHEIINQSSPEKEHQSASALAATSPLGSVPDTTDREARDIGQAAQLCAACWAY